MPLPSFRPPSLRSCACNLIECPRLFLVCSAPTPAPADNSAQVAAEQAAAKKAAAEQAAAKKAAAEQAAAQRAAEEQAG